MQDLVCCDYFRTPVIFEGLISTELLEIKGIRTTKKPIFDSWIPGDLELSL